MLDSFVKEEISKNNIYNEKILENSNVYSKFFGLTSSIANIDNFLLTGNLKLIY